MEEQQYKSIDYDIEVKKFKRSNLCTKGSLFLIFVGLVIFIFSVGGAYFPQTVLIDLDSQRTGQVLKFSQLDPEIPMFEVILPIILKNTNTFDTLVQQMSVDIIRNKIIIGKAKQLYPVTLLALETKQIEILCQATLNDPEVFEEILKLFDECGYTDHITLDANLHFKEVYVKGVQVPDIDHYIEAKKCKC